MHDGHQVAQTLTSAGLPIRSAWVRGLPSCTVFSAKAGNGLPIIADGNSVGSRNRPR
ncbi:hypothetical protein D3C77_803070 [compost metagenome]